MRADQKRSQLTREKIVHSAVQALLETNIYSLRFSQIAKIAKVPQPLIDYHFSNMDSLLMAMVFLQLGKLKKLSMEAIEKNTHAPRAALEAYIRTPFALSEKDIGFRAVWSSFYHLAVVNRNFAELNRQVRETGNERIQMLIQNIIVRESRKTSSPNNLTLHLANTIQGLITGCGFIASSESGGDFTGMANSVVQSSNQLINSYFAER